MLEQLLFITTSDIPGAGGCQGEPLSVPSASPRCPWVLLVTLWPQADLSEEKKGVPGEVVTTGAGPFAALPREVAPWDALGHLQGQYRTHWAQKTAHNPGTTQPATILVKHSTAHGLSLVVVTIPSW